MVSTQKSKVQTRGGTAKTLAGRRRVCCAGGRLEAPRLPETRDSDLAKAFQYLNRI